ncbi:MAG: hypothetical protein H7Z42_08835, partial [Roseiflexaceae bacterium]|nr:hypothetical protein [Roseiflexaceae bacterium]
MAVTRAETPIPQIARYARPALIVGAVALLLSIVGAFFASDMFWQSYLFAFLFWFALSMGGLGLLMLQYVVQGRWGQTIKRILEAMALNLPLLAIAFVPILVSLFLGSGALYPWNNPETVNEFEMLQFRVETGYLTPLWFTVRAVLYFAVWLGLMVLLTRGSREQDANPSDSIHKRLGRTSALGIVLFMLSYSFATIDWGMTTEVLWYSTMYPVLYVVISALTGIAFSILVLSFIRKLPQISRIATANRFHDLSTLAFAFTVLWTYVNFSQFLIMYSANISEEAEFYVHRTQGGWGILGGVVTICCFILPFLTLLGRRTKRSPQRMRAIAAFIIGAQVLNLFYTLIPAFHTEQFTVNWTDIVAWVGLGGLWIGLFLTTLSRNPLVVENDPRQAHCLERHHGDAF